MSKVFVTKSFLPDIEDYTGYVKKIYDNGVLTNQGPCLQGLESKLKTYLNINNLHCVNNGTIALQLALNALNITEGEVITTPFSYVATISSILWERCTPIFVDINSDDFTIDYTKIEVAITSKTKAIMGVHVFGYPCAVDEIEKIAQKHNLAVIYDAAHAFGVKYKGISLLSYGDVSTCSFHATKLFHTIEGGLVVAKDDKVFKKLDLIKRFGHYDDDHLCLGINAKMNEFCAAMGLANFPHLGKIIEKRRFVSELYDKYLDGTGLQRPKVKEELEYNYAYYPVVFKNEKTLLAVLGALKNEEIFARRYFYPSLNQLPYLSEKTSCPVSENIASRIACLPLFVDLAEETVVRICDIIKNVLFSLEL